MALLDESLAISSELGMRPLMERVQSRREILGAWIIQVAILRGTNVGLFDLHRCLRRFLPN